MTAVNNSSLRVFNQHHMKIRSKLEQQLRKLAAGELWEFRKLRDNYEKGVSYGLYLGYKHSAQRLESDFGYAVPVINKESRPVYLHLEIDEASFQHDKHAEGRIRRTRVNPHD